MPIQSELIREFRHLEERASQAGELHQRDIEVVRRLIGDDGRIDRLEADLLVELHKRVRVHSPAFEHFYYAALKKHVLADGRISAEEAEWLRDVLLADGKLQDEERRFLHELKGEAAERSPEFEALFEECDKLPPEQHTSR